MPLSPGSTFERYEIESLVGRGGMGEVYRAIDSRLRRPVALKVLRTDRDGMKTTEAAGGVQRLLREARAAAALNHANSVAIYELGEAEGIPYIAMEFVTGQSLRTYCGAKSVSVETKVSWLVDAARALFAAHKAGLIHRDIKPSNIMVSEEGVVKVLDFGLAKPTTRLDISGFQTAMGRVLGTPRYMAPEQLEGVEPSAASDQFAFGLVAYELVSGEYPGGPLAGRPRPLDEFVAAVSPSLAAVIARMLERKPESRYATMDDAAHALRKAVPSIGNVRAAAPPASGRRATSDAPTQAAEQQPVSEEIIVDVAMPISKGATLPLAQPLSIAAGMPLSNASPTNRTLPLARPIGPSMPPMSAPRSPNVPVSEASRTPSSPVLPSAVSGVYATDPPQKKAPEPAPPPVQKSRTSVLLAILAVAIIGALAGGAVVAWLAK